MNTLQILTPYKYNGMWVFDDPVAELSREPFVCGIDTMIEILTKSIPNAEEGFSLIFSHLPFPKYEIKLEWKREEHGGNWYYCPQLKIEGWLCPALFKYFPEAPKELYAKFEEIKLT